LQNKAITKTQGIIRNGIVCLLILSALFLDLNILHIFAHAPVTPIHYTVRNSTILVQSIDRHATWNISQIHVGDTLVSLGGRYVDAAAMLEDPDLASSWKEQAQYVAWKTSLYETSRTGFIDATFQTARGLQALRLPTAPQGWLHILRHTWGQQLFCWSYLLFTLALWRRKLNAATSLMLLSGIGLFASVLMMPCFWINEFALSPHNLKWMYYVNYCFAQTAVLSIYLAVVLPFPARILTHRPWLGPVLCLFYPLQLILHFWQILPGPFYTSFLLAPSALAALVTILIIRMFKETDPQRFQQLQWVATGSLIGILPWLFFSILPPLFEFPSLPPSTISLLFLATPVCFAFGILRYRLADVGYIFDQALAHAATFAILTLCVLLAWHSFNQHLINAKISHKFMLSASMAIGILLYAPLCRSLFLRLNILLGKFRPRSSEAIQKLLTLSEQFGDPRQALTATLEWVFTPKEIVWINQEGLHVPWLESIHAAPEMNLGYEHGNACPQKWQPAACFTIHAEQDSCALVLAPSRIYGWSRRDIQLIHTILQTSTPLLTIYAIKEQHAALELTLQRQRDGVVREINEGLGSKLESIAAFSATSELLDFSTIKHRLQEVATTSSEAIDSLRTGLSILSFPPGAFGPNILSLILRAERMLSIQDIEVSSEIDEMVSSLHLTGQQVFNLLSAMQEAINNIAQHSQAAQANIEVNLHSSLLRVIISDDGLGFDPKNVCHQRGISNMTTRMESIQGSVTLATNLGAGTTVRLTLEVK